MCIYVYIHTGINYIYIHIHVGMVCIYIYVCVCVRSGKKRKNKNKMPWCQGMHWLRRGCKVIDSSVLPIMKRVLVAFPIMKVAIIPDGNLT